MLKGIAPFTREEMGALVRLGGELKLVTDGTHPTFLFAHAHELPLWYDPSLLPVEIRNCENVGDTVKNFLLSTKIRRCTLKRCMAVARGLSGILV